MKLGRVREHYRVRPGYWFRPKMLGWGAVPVTWQGWLVTAVFIAAAMGIANLAEHRSPAWLVLLVPAVPAFLLVVWRKTDGPWGFRWGQDDRDGGAA